MLPAMVKTIPTMQSVIKDNPDFATLIRAVVKLIGKDSIDAVNTLGANAGFSGFIYYTETHDFAMKHRDAIIKLLEWSNEQFGECKTLVEFIAGFQEFKKCAIDPLEYKELYQYLGDANPPPGRITNMMAWFALEEVCRMFDR